MASSNDELKEAIRNFQRMITETMEPINRIKDSYSEVFNPITKYSEELKRSYNQIYVNNASYKDLQKTIDRVLEPYASMLKDFHFAFRSNDSLKYKSDDLSFFMNDDYVEIDEAISDEIEEKYCTFQEGVRIHTGHGTVLIRYSLIVSIIGVLVTILIAFCQEKSSTYQINQIVENQKVEKEYLQKLTESSQEVVRIEDLLSRLLESLNDSYQSSEDSRQDGHVGPTPT